MENKKVELSYRQIVMGVSTLIALLGGELAIGKTLFTQESDRIEIGLYIDRETKQLKYTHFDGITYNAYFNSIAKRYFIINNQGEKFWCN